MVFPSQCAGCGALGTGLCRHCAPFEVAPASGRFGDLRVVAYGSYEGTLRTAVLALKDGRRDVAEALGSRIALLIDAGTHLVPVPTTPKRRRVRGVDGVALIAAVAARLTGAIVTEALVQHAGDTQRGRRRGQRLAACNRFSCRPGRIEGRAVTLIDDVCTTGATLTDCARAIAVAGGHVEGAVVVAATKGADEWKSARGN
ncbi:MAG: ComF family protein [Candidatus Eremiobacteraeota bacterium]|nr:ComF family protein [Candidatus Eremiobacteraeota bacterium]